MARPSRPALNGRFSQTRLAIAGEGDPESTRAAVSANTLPPVWVDESPRDNLSEASSVGMKRLVMVTLVVGVSTAVGCGSSTPRALSASEFRARAEAICAEANTAQAALAQPKTGAEVRAYLEAGYASAEAELARLKALVPPPELKADFDAAISLIGQRDATVKRVVDELKAGKDPEAAVTAAEPAITALNDRADAKALALGLTVCGKDDAAGAAQATVPATRFAADLQGLGTALTAFGSSMSSVSTATDLTSRADQLQAEVDRVAAALSRIGGYRLSDAALEGKRARIVQKGAPFLAILRDIVSQSRAANVRGLQDLLPKLQSISADFTTAVTS